MENRSFKQFKGWTVECIASLIVIFSYFNPREQLSDRDKLVFNSSIGSAVVSIFGLVSCLLPYLQNSCLVQTVLVWFIAIWRSATTVLGIIGLFRSDAYKSLFTDYRFLGFHPNVYFFSLWAFMASIHMLASWSKEYINKGTSWSASTNWILLGAMGFFTMSSALVFRDRTEFAVFSNSNEYNITDNDLLLSIHNLEMSNGTMTDWTMENSTVGYTVIGDLTTEYLAQEERSLTKPSWIIFGALLEGGAIEATSPCEMTSYSCFRIRYAVGLSAATAVVACIMAPLKRESPTCHTDINIVLILLWISALPMLTVSPGPAIRAGNLYFGLYICYFLVLNIFISSITSGLTTEKTGDKRDSNMERNESVGLDDLWQAAYDKLERNDDQQEERNRCESYEALFEQPEGWDDLDEPHENQNQTLEQIRARNSEYSFASSRSPARNSSKEMIDTAVDETRLTSSGNYEYGFAPSRKPTRKLNKDKYKSAFNIAALFPHKRDEAAVDATSDRIGANNDDDDNKNNSDSSSGRKKLNRDMYASAFDIAALFPDEMEKSSSERNGYLKPREWKRKVSRLRLWFVLLTMGIVLTHTKKQYNPPKMVLVYTSLSIIISCIGIVTCLRTSKISNILQMLSILLAFSNCVYGTYLLKREAENSRIFGYSSVEEEINLLLGEEGESVLDDPNVFFGIWISLISAIMLVTSALRASLVTTDWVLFAMTSVALILSCMKEIDALMVVDGSKSDSLSCDTQEDPIYCQRLTFAKYLAIASLGLSLPMTFMCRFGPSLHMVVSFPLMIAWGFGTQYVTFTQSTSYPAIIYFAFWVGIYLSLELLSINLILLKRARKKDDEELLTKNENEEIDDGEEGNVDLEAVMKEESLFSKDSGSDIPDLYFVNSAQSTTTSGIDLLMNDEKEEMDNEDEGKLDIEAEKKEESLSSKENESGIPDRYLVDKAPSTTASDSPKSKQNDDCYMNGSVKTDTNASQSQDVATEENNSADVSQSCGENLDDAIQGNSFGSPMEPVMELVPDEQQPKVESVEETDVKELPQMRTKSDLKRNPLSYSSSLASSDFMDNLDHDPIQMDLTESRIELFLGGDQQYSSGGRSTMTDEFHSARTTHTKTDEFHSARTTHS